MKRILLFGLLLALSAIPSFAQTTVVSGTVIDTGAQPWFNGSVVATFVPAPGQPGPYIWSGGAFNQNLAITATIAANGAYTMNVPSNTAMSPAGSRWTFTANSGTTALNTGAAVTQTVGPGGTLTLNFTPPPPIVNAGPGATAYVDASVAASTGQTYFQLNSVVANGSMRVCLGSFVANQCNLWGALGSSGGGGAGNPANPDTSIQINKAGVFGSVAGFGVDNSTSPTIFFDPLLLKQEGDACFSGPRPYIDISCPPYNARPVTINTTISGSGTTITTPVTTFQTGDTMIIANPVGGIAPAFSAPTGLAVLPAVVAGKTTTNAPVVAGLSGASPYTYCVFGVDALGGASQCSTPVTITTGNATLGKTQFPISSWSLLANTLTFITTSPNNLPQGAAYHSTGTSNAFLAGVWAIVSNIGTSSTFNTVNVPPYSATTSSGTGGNITVFATNSLTWTYPSGGSSLTLPYEFGICAQRPGDGAMHLVGMSYPSTPYTLAQSGITVTQFNDYGPTLTSNNPIPWYLSDANCTAGAPQTELLGETVTAGGGTTTLTVTPSLPGTQTNAPARLHANGFNTAIIAAAAAQVPVYIPPGNYPINAAVGVTNGVTIWQSGNLTANSPIFLTTGVQWFGFNGAQNGQSFAWGPGPVVFCNAYPCVHSTQFGAQGQGGIQVRNVQFKNTGANGLIAVIDSNWGEDWSYNSFISGIGNNDNMGIDVMIRPGAAGYTFDHDLFSGGPNQVIDQTWTPLFYLDKGFGGCCGGGLGVGNVKITNSQWNRRGLYDIMNGGDGPHLSINNAYGQGFITPKVTVQNISGFNQGQVDLDYMFHDTTSQATYEGICGVGCSGGPGMILRLGFVSPLSVDAGTIPYQITGGGNQPVQNVVAGFAISGFAPNTGPTITYAQGALHATFPFSADAGFTSVPTPSLCLQNSGFCVTHTAATLTANRSVIDPDQSGVNCVTGMVGCLPILDTGIANAYAGCPTVALTTVPPGFFFTMEMVHPNSGPITINLCSLGAIPVKKNGGTGGSVGSDLITGDIKGGQWFCGQYDGTNIQSLCALGNASGGGVGITGTPTVGQIACFASLVGSGSITNCAFAGDVSWTFPSGVATSNINSIQGVPVTTNTVVPGQNLCVEAGPVYMNCYPGVNYNPQTGSYSVTCPGDRFGDVDFTGSAPNPAIITLPQALTGTCTGFNAGFVIHNGGTVDVNLQAITSLVDGNSGSTGVWIMPGASRFVYSDALTTPAYHTLHVPTGFGGVNAQSTNYTATAADNGKLISMSCSAACVFKLPNPIPTTGETTAGTRYHVTVISNGSSLATVNLNGANFNGAATPPALISFLEQDFSTDGTNWAGNAPIICSTNVTCTPSTFGLSITVPAGGSAPVFQTSGVSNTNQALLNFQGTGNGTSGANNITPTNPSGGIEQFAITNVQGTDAKVASAATVSNTVGQPVCSDANAGVTTTSCVAPFSALTDGATVTWTSTVPNDNRTLTFTAHGGSRTLNVSGLINGGNYQLGLIQDATGGENLVLGTGCTWFVAGPLTTTLTLSTTANGRNFLAWTYDGTNCWATLGLYK